MNTGEKIRYYRQLRHLTQEDLGKRCLKPQEGKPDATIAGSTIRSYERGTLNPKPETLKIIASALGVYWTDLLGDDSREINVSISETSEKAGYYMTKYISMMDDQRVWLWIAEQVQRYQKCGGEEAGKVADVIIKCVKNKEKSHDLVSFSELTDFVPEDYKNAAFAVLQSGVIAALKELGAEKNLRVEPLTQGFDVWAKAYETEKSRSEHTIGSDLTADEVIALLNSYDGKEKPPQDTEDPETAETSIQK